MITKVTGELEICHDRGVIYFHFTDKVDIMKYGQMTPLRICGIDTPIPPLESERQIDLHVDSTDHTGK
jgi:hypothetical protein